MMEESQIQKFYKSCNVFITGGTGFMGKILVEKLLRSTEVSTVYLLVREKKQKNIHTRIDELFDDVIFNRLKSEQPKFKHRIEAISGDCSIPGLGLTITDRQTLISNTHVIFHVAATVRFDENLKLSYSINVNGTKEILEMAKQMKSLKALMHVSTAYSNCHLDEIDEKLYNYPFSYENIGALLEKVNKQEANMLTPRIIGSWPNTYNFTKALAESLIKDRGAGMPIGIFRPTIVISTYKEPVEGWIDNLYGPTGVCAAAISGVLRVMPCQKDNIADVVPVDTCVAALICAAWDVATKDCERTIENMPIYNYVSSIENPITWNEFIELNLIHGKKYPTSNLLWAIFVMFTPNLFLYWLLKLMYHTIPALLIDLLAIVTGNKPGMLRMYKKIHKFSDILRYFSLRHWTFTNKNTVNLWEKLNKTDRELFPLSITTVHWLLYFRRYIMGIRFYLLKDAEANLEKARTRSRRFDVIHRTLKILIVFIACNVASSLISKVYNSIFW